MGESESREKLANKKRTLEEASLSNEIIDLSRPPNESASSVPSLQPPRSAQFLSVLLSVDARREIWP